MRKMKLLLAALLTIAIASCGGGGGGGDTGGSGTTTYTLTVTKTGTGSGTVTSSAAGISCGGTCSAAYNSGASVTLTATADSGSTFFGWSGGGCSGTGTCTVAINAATDVTATFNTGSGGAASTESYNFYSDKNGGLYAVDSSSPTSPQTVDTGVASDSTATIAYGSYDSTTKVITGGHDHYVVYAKGGKIYRVNAVKGQSLTPAQVSSETGAATVCDTDPDSDLMNVDNSIYFYKLPGTDGNCNTSDDVEKMVTVGMSASTSPVTITPKKLIRYTTIFDANRSIVGFLVTDSGVLKKCNLNLSTCSDLKTGVSNVSNIGNYPAQSKTYLEIDNGLYVYDAGANTLSSSLYTFTGTSINGNADSSAFYFADDTKILKLPHNSSSVTTLITETSSINNYRFTDNSLVYEVSQTLKAVPKTGGAATTLASVSGAYDQIDVWYSRLPGNHVYYDKTVSGVPSAGHILDDGTGGSEVGNANWIGMSLSTTVSLSTGHSIAKIVRVDGCTSTGCGGGTLKSFEASTYSGEIILGQLPTDVSSFWRFGYGSNLIGAGYSIDYSLSDIFYLNVDTANSLVRITNTTVGEDIFY